MAHSVFHRATRVHHIVSTAIEINVRHTGEPAQYQHRSLELYHLLLSSLITGFRITPLKKCH